LAQGSSGNFFVCEAKPIAFRNLGKSLPNIPKKKSWEFTIRMADFAEFGYCPYRAWHLSRGTTPVVRPETAKAMEIGKTIHENLDRGHAEKISALRKATETDRLDKSRPLEFYRNLRVHLYRRPFLYLGKIDNVCRKTDGNFYIAEDKTTRQLPSSPWPDHLLQVYTYCAGMAGTHWRRYSAKYLCWRITYRDKITTEILGEFGGFYDTLSHDTLLTSLENFETIYRGDDPGLEVNPNKCIICRYGTSCPFRK